MSSFQMWLKQQPYMGQNPYLQPKQIFHLYQAWLENQTNNPNLQSTRQNKRKMKDLKRKPTSKNNIIIEFKLTTGDKIFLYESAETTIGDLIKIFLKRLGLSEEAIERDIFFLYNACPLNHKSKKALGSMFRNTVCITVYDLTNQVIGG